MVSDKNSSKVSEDKENSPEDVDSNGSKAEEHTVEEGDESSDGKSVDTAADSQDGEANDADADEEIEDAEIVAEYDEDAGEPSEPDDVVEVEEALEETPSPLTPTRTQANGSTTRGLVFGGLIAGAFGFLVATFVVPEGWPRPPADPTEAMLAELDGQADRIEALVAQIAEFESATGRTATVVDAEMSELVARIDVLSEELAAASKRVEALENAPAPPVAPAPDVNFDAEMETFRGELEAATEAARAEVEAAQARAAEIEAEARAAAEAAETAALVATLRAALAEVSAALESGAPFPDALADFPNVPNALAAVAVEGVPTLAALRAGFPDAARDALQASQDVPADASATERMAAFFRKQTNARSLSPRAGDDPDAVLSRAEAALNDGDLNSALTELAGLPDEAAQSLSGWITEAEARVAAVAAAQLLRNELN